MVVIIICFVWGSDAAVVRLSPGSVPRGPYEVLGMETTLPAVLSLCPHKKQKILRKHIEVCFHICMSSYRFSQKVNMPWSTTKVLHSTM